MDSVKRFSLVLVLVLVATALLVAACSGGAATPSGTTGTGSTGSSGSLTIVEQGFAFNPASLNVKVGDTVTFENKDSAPHHVVVGTTDLGDQASGVTVTWKATAAGTFPVKCTIHPNMTGEIVVAAQ